MYTFKRVIVENFRYTQRTKELPVTPLSRCKSLSPSYLHFPVSHAQSEWILLHSRVWELSKMELENGALPCSYSVLLMALPAREAGKVDAKDQHS